MRHDQECLGKIREDKVKNMTTFLDTLKNSEAIFGLLHKMICERYPGQGQREEEDRVKVRPSASLKLHIALG